MVSYGYIAIDPAHPSDIDDELALSPKDIALPKAEVGELDP